MVANKSIITISDARAKSQSFDPIRIKRSPILAEDSLCSEYLVDKAPSATEVRDFPVEQRNADSRRATK